MEAANPKLDFKLEISNFKFQILDSEPRPQLIEQSLQVWLQGQQIRAVTGGAPEMERVGGSEEAAHDFPGSALPLRRWNLLQNVGADQCFPSVDEAVSSARQA